MSIEHPPLSIVVANRLRERIESGALAPGTRLNERTLCQQLKVSRTPLREAYRILSSEGLVELLPKRGARVVQLSATDVADIFDVLAVVEGLSGRLAAVKATQADLDEIETLHREMAEAWRAGDMLRYSLASKGTHVAINAVARNPVLRNIYLRLNAQVQNLRYRSNQDPDNWAQSVRDHEAFVTAVLARNGEQAERLLRAHLLVKKNFALSAEAGRDERGDEDAQAEARLETSSETPSAAQSGRTTRSGERSRTRESRPPHSTVRSRAALRDREEK